MTLSLPQASPLLARPVLAPGHTLLFAVPKTGLFMPGASVSAQHTQGQVSTRLYRINHCPQGHPGPLTLLCFCLSPKPLLRQPFAPFCVCCYYQLPAQASYPCSVQCSARRRCSVNVRCGQACVSRRRPPLRALPVLSYPPPLVSSRVPSSGRPAPCRLPGRTELLFSVPSPSKAASVSCSDRSAGRSQGRTASYCSESTWFTQWVLSK